MNPFRKNQKPAQEVEKPERPVADHQLDVEEVIAAAPDLAKVEPKAQPKRVDLLTATGYDFRELPEPVRTLKRVEAFVLDQRFTHGEHAAGALLILAFQNVPPDETKLLSVRQLLSDARGFSATTRTALLKHMKEFGLLQEISFKQKVGTEIKLTF